MTTTEVFAAYEMPSEYGQSMFDVYSKIGTAGRFYGHFRAADREDAIAQAKAKAKA